MKNEIELSKYEHERERKIEEQLWLLKKLEYLSKQVTTEASQFNHLLITDSLPRIKEKLKAQFKPSKDFSLTATFTIIPGLAYSPFLFNLDTLHSDLKRIIIFSLQSLLSYFDEKLINDQNFRLGSFLEFTQDKKHPKLYEQHIKDKHKEFLNKFNAAYFHFVEDVDKKRNTLQHGNIKFYIEPAKIIVNFKPNESYDNLEKNMKKTSLNIGGTNIEKHLSSIIKTSYEFRSFCLSEAEKCKNQHT